MSRAALEVLVDQRVKAICKAMVGEAVRNAMQEMRKRQNLIITDLKDVGGKLVDESYTDSDFFEQNLAGAASCVLHLRPRLLTCPNLTIRSLRNQSCRPPSSQA